MAQVLIIMYRHLFSITPFATCATTHASPTPPHPTQGISGPHPCSTPPTHTLSWKSATLDGADGMGGASVTAAADT